MSMVAQTPLSTLQTLIAITSHCPNPPLLSSHIVGKVATSQPQPDILLLPSTGSSSPCRRSASTRPIWTLRAVLMHHAHAIAPLAMTRHGQALKVIQGSPTLQIHMWKMCGCMHEWVLRASVRHSSPEVPQKMATTGRDTNQTSRDWSKGGQHLLHHDSVVALKGDINIHVILHGPNLVDRQEALPPAALAAGLQDLHPVPGCTSLQATADNVDLLPVLCTLLHVQSLQSTHTSCHKSKVTFSRLSLSYSWSSQMSSGGVSAFPSSSWRALAGKRSYGAWFP